MVSSARKFLAVAFGLVVFSFGSQLLLATPVSFYTTGIFSDSGSNSITSGAVTIVFTPAGSHDSPMAVEVPGNFQLGNFHVSRTGNNAEISFPGAFTLTVIQVSPSSGPGEIDGVFQGTIRSNDTGSLAIDFTGYQPPEIDGFIYTLTGLVTIGGDADLLTLPDLSKNDTPYDKGIFADITKSSTTTNSELPEPASLLLLGSGLVAMGVMLNRKRK